MEPHLSICLKKEDWENWRAKEDQEFEPVDAFLEDEELLEKERIRESCLDEEFYARYMATETFIHFFYPFARYVIRNKWTKNGEIDIILNFVKEVIEKNKISHAAYIINRLEEQGSSEWVYHRFLEILEVYKVITFDLLLGLFKDLTDPKIIDGIINIDVKK